MRAINFRFENCSHNNINIVVRYERSSGTRCNVRNPKKGRIVEANFSGGLCCRIRRRLHRLTVDDKLVEDNYSTGSETSGNSDLSISRLLSSTTDRRRPSYTPTRARDSRGRVKYIRVSSYRLLITVPWIRPSIRNACSVYLSHMTVFFFHSDGLKLTLTNNRKIKKKKNRSYRLFVRTVVLSAVVAVVNWL